MQNSNDIAELSKELSHQRYMLNQEQVHTFFKDISVPDYISLHNISKFLSEHNHDSGKAYLKDLAVARKLPVPQISRIAGRLRDNGLVSWTHDDDGSEGTYITITEYGHRLMEKQEKQLRDYFTRVTESFGKENMTSLLQLMNRLETVMDQELPAAEDPV